MPSTIPDLGSDPQHGGQAQRLLRLLRVAEQIAERRGRPMSELCAPGTLGEAGEAVGEEPAQNPAGRK